MLTSVDTKVIASEKATELLAGPSVRAWSACASVWARVFVLSGPGWVRAPQTADAMREAFSVAMRRAARIGDFVPDARLVATLQEFEVEDDGSAEWNYMIDLMGMIQTAVGGGDLSDCLHVSLQTYLQESFHMIGRVHGAAAGRPLRWPEAEELVAADPEWARVVAFVRAL